MRPFGALLGAILLTACSIAGLTPRAGVHIDYLNVVRLGGITYLSQSPSGGRPIVAGDLGPVVGIVRTRLADLNDPARQLRDGDAAYLPVGTRLYQVKGYQPRFRLSASNQGRWLVFEAFENPAATNGGHLLDIQGKVAAIEIDDVAQQDRPVGFIESAAEVDRLVGLIVSAPVDRLKPPNGPTGYDLVFVMNDGTISRRTFVAQSGSLAGGIQLPPAFGSAIAVAVANPPPDPIPPAAAMPGRAYPYRLHTRCGLDWRTRFDATYWDLASRPGGPIGDPYQEGTMTLIGPDIAQFTFAADSRAQSVRFTRHPRGLPLKGPSSCA